MQFLFQPLTWAFFLVLLPPLIHLINLMRQKRVEWAAMEFLLKSHKKHRRWIWLKQLLLLLLRMFAIAAAVAMFAKLVTKDEWADIFSGFGTHHYVVLDDSFSMSERAGSLEAFDLATNALNEICLQAEKQSTQQKLTLIRFSQAGRTATTENDAAVITDFNGEIINASDFQQRLNEKSQTLQVADLAEGPVKALETVLQMIQASTKEKRVLHLVSDFRRQTWAEPGPIKDILRKLSQEDTDIRFVRCSPQQDNNLAITDLSVSDGTKAAGVPLFVDLKVKNLGPQPARKVQVQVTSRFFPTGPDGIESSAVEEQLPNVVFDQIGVGESVSRQVQVFFPTAGQHYVTAELTSDALRTDNRRWCTVDLPELVPALLVDDTPAGENAFFLESVFQPGPRTKTGIQPVRQNSVFLRDSTLDELKRFSAIYVMGVDRLDERARQNLEDYVADGGGVAFFLGPEADPAFFSEWHNSGEGLFPIEIVGPAELSFADDGSPDIQFVDSPIFGALLGERNPFAASIRIAKYQRTPALWEIPSDSTIRILARLRHGEPLVVERYFQQGKIVVFNTTAGTAWNNWAREPTFIVVALQLHGYLSASTSNSPSHLVGTSLDIQFDAAKYGPKVNFRLPTASEQSGAVIQQTARMGPKDSPIYRFSIGRSERDDRRTGATDRKGIYEVQATTLDGARHHRRFAFNVDNQESDLTPVDVATMLENLRPIKVTVHEADALVYGSINDNEASWSEILLVIIIVCLMGEQLLAYSFSYHPKHLLSSGGIR